MSTPVNPQDGLYDHVNAPAAPVHDGGILGALEQIAATFLGRHDAPPPPEPPDLRPVIDTRLSSPPYAGMTPESPGRYQQEVFAVRLNAAGPSTASLNIRTRCDFYTLQCYPFGAVAPDANDGVWVALSGTPPAIPTLAAGVVQNVPLHLDVDGKLTIHGAEQTISLTLDSTIDLVVLITANTNVPNPY